MNRFFEQLRCVQVKLGQGYGENAGHCDDSTAEV